MSRFRDVCTHNRVDTVSLVPEPGGPAEDRGGAGLAGTAGIP